MVQGPQRADPPAERAADKESGNDDRQAPQQSAVEGAAGQRAGQSRERVDFQEQPDGIGYPDIGGRASREPRHFGHRQQKDEEGQKNDLADAADTREFRSSGA